MLNQLFNKRKPEVETAPANVFIEPRNQVFDEEIYFKMFRGEVRKIVWCGGANWVSCRRWKEYYAPEGNIQ
jgi:hypothetical protein